MSWNQFWFQSVHTRQRWAKLFLGFRSSYWTQWSSLSKTVNQRGMQNRKLECWGFSVVPYYASQCTSYFDRAFWSKSEANLCLSTLCLIMPLIWMTWHGICTRGSLHQIVLKQTSLAWIPSPRLRKIDESAISTAQAVPCQIRYWYEVNIWVDYLVKVWHSVVGLWHGECRHRLILVKPSRKEQQLCIG